MKRKKQDLSEEEKGTIGGPTRSPILCMDVKIAESQVEQILIFKKDNVSRVVDAFCKRHSKEYSPCLNNFPYRFELKQEK